MKTEIEFDDMPDDFYETVEIDDIKESGGAIAYIGDWTIRFEGEPLQLLDVHSHGLERFSSAAIEWTSTDRKSVTIKYF